MKRVHNIGRVMGMFKLIFRVTAIIVLFMTPSLAQENENVQRPRDAKLVRQYDDGKGHLVKEITYSQGNMKVTETIIMPKPQKLTYGYRAAINPDTLDMDSLWMVVDKRRYNVRVYYKERMIRSYRAVFGPKPMLDKCMQGDRCTPEGWFKINDKHISSKYNKFLGISYPTAESKAKFNKLKKDGKIPRNALIGGNIGLHGIWTGGDDMIELGVGWTDGCIALKNSDINDLYRLVGVGARVYIKK